MTTKSIEDELNNLQTELNKGITLFDYFLVIGPKPEIFMNDWLYESDQSELINEYIEQISPVLLTQFPPIEKKISGLDETIIQHIFPNGYTVHAFQSPPEPKAFSIILDNNLYSIDYNYKYVTCLKFYESINSYHKLYDKYNQMLDKPKSCLSKSEIPFTTRDNASITNTNNNTTGEANNTTRISTTRTTIGSSKKLKYRNLYLAKCICLVSLHPFFLEYEKILMKFYNYSMGAKVSIPIEKFVQNVIIEIPAPPRGLFSIEYHLFNEIIFLKKSCMNELPSLSVEFKRLFEKFKVNQVMMLFKHVLLESRIVFFSKDIGLLTPLIYSSLALIYPFEYPFNIASILPKDAYHLIENVTNVIVGVNEKYDPTFFQDNDIDVSDLTILIVDIDNKNIEVRKPTTKKYEELPELPKQYREKLEKRIVFYYDLYKTSSVSNTEILGNKKDTLTVNHEELFIQNIRNSFFKFFINILKSYYKFLDHDFYAHKNTQSHIHNAFKVKEFLQTIDNIDKPFYNKLILETQLFVDFIFKRMTPKSNKEKLQILYFEEKIFEKFTRKRISKNFNNQQVFISSKAYQHKNVYKIKTVDYLTAIEDTFYSTKENQITCLMNGIIVDNKIDLNGKKGHVFTSPIFPRLLSEFYFKTTIGQKGYLIPNNLSDGLEQINSDLISKSHLNSVEVNQCEMENYIYLCWIKIWAYSFWYQDEQERQYRFNQLLNVLKRVIHHEMDIFNLLFQVLIANKAKEENKLELYNLLINCRLSPSSYIFDIITKLYNKNRKSLRQTEVQSHKIENSAAYRKRTFKNKNDTRIIKEQIKIYDNENCLECKKKVRLNDIMSNINKAKKQNIWAECPNCHKDFFPMLTIRFGYEYNKGGDLKINTSLNDDFALYSPFTLYYNLIPTLAKDHRIDIDNFKQNFLPIFWNCVYYFKQMGLDYDFFLPYEDSTTKMYIGMSMMKNNGFDVSYQSTMLRDSIPLKRKISTKNTLKVRKYLSSLLILRNEIEYSYIATKKNNGDTSYEYIPTITNENSIIPTEESMINPNGFIDNSSICFDNMSRYTDTDIYDNEYSIGRGRCKTLASINYPLKEIKEDQNENTASAMNTPLKPIGGGLSNKQITNFFMDQNPISSSKKSSKNLSVNDIDCMWEEKASGEMHNNTNSNHASLSFGHNCSVIAPEYDINKTPNQFEEELSPRKDCILPRNLNIQRFSLPPEDNNIALLMEKKSTPTKVDFSMNFNVIKEFKEHYICKTDRSIEIRNENNHKGSINSTKTEERLVSNLLCQSPETYPNNSL